MTPLKGHRHQMVIESRRQGYSLAMIQILTSYSVKHVQRILTKAKVYKRVP